MQPIAVPAFTTAAAAIEQARMYVAGLEAVADFDHGSGTTDAGTGMEPAFRLLSIAARTCLEQARTLTTDDSSFTSDLTQVHRSLVFVNETFYLGMSHPDRCRLAKQRGFEYPEFTEWTPREKPALVFVLNDAYRWDIIEKMRVQARAYARAGRLDQAVQVLTVSALSQALSAGASEQEAKAAIEEAAAEGRRLLARLAA
ncbi:hypothetical protein ACFFMN_23965 [Planobispora siamensis]|uniref:Uncharacterized protein n=1 Tax=Planobispora siamensis TaxID=936338 RepID=A0A8J3SN67_9ACTN|nr:hypothetical protein [Planobispora siamensis]GIH95394.1 hypothetical protein Psi01_60240 [Planobispora siamensis]